MSEQGPEGCNSIALAESLLEYIKANPSLRFWQALRNWSGVNFIFAAQYITLETGQPMQALDTFYWEGRSPLYPVKKTGTHHNGR